MTDTIVFLDTETLGVHPDAPIWDFAAMRRSPDGTADVIQFTIQHDPGNWLEDLPERFREDYQARYIHDDAATEWAEAAVIDVYTRDAVVVCCNPLFDLDSKRVTNLLQRNGIEPTWHYHPLDISSMAIGYLAGRGQLFAQPWKSDALSAAVGVDPAEYPRHTALGDVQWAAAQWDVIHGQQWDVIPGEDGGNGTRNR